jgi:hypothetical protein
MSFGVTSWMNGYMPSGDSIEVRRHTEICDDNLMSREL